MRGAALVLAVAVVGCGDDLATVVRAGGDTTVEDRSSNAFSLPAPNLGAADLARHLDGDLAFESTFVTGAAPVNGGLGPVFNNTSCVACHNRDGRGRAVINPDGPSSFALVRVSVVDGDPDVPGGAVPVPGVGLQLQDHAVFGVAPEARIDLSWIDVDGAYADGTPYALRRPALTITLADGTPLPADVMTSLRQPPAVFGLGLLEAIDASTLEALADPDDADGDGISGRINYVWDAVAQEARIGRFGAKANTPSLVQQAGAANVNDMGISNPRFPAVDQHDVGADVLDATAFYTQTLGVPARLELSAEAARGEALFDAYGCASCHVPALTTGAHPLAVLANQDIAPYTDLLVHDLGDGLADGRPDFMATGTEWRTPPLWGLGLVQTVLPGGSYLHDGRARTVAEAILWHGGEGASAQARFVAAARTDREALLAFLAAL